MPRRTAGKCLLVIDDDEPVRAVTCAILEGSDIHVLQAANGRSGLQLAQQHLAEIDLILLDFSLPDIRGDEVLRHLQQLQPDIPVLLFSGYDRYEVAQSLGKSVAFSFLQKPYTMQELLQAIEQQLLRTQLLTPPPAPPRHQGGVADSSPACGGGWEGVAQ